MSTSRWTSPRRSISRSASTLLRGLESRSGITRRQHAVRPEGADEQGGDHRGVDPAAHAQDRAVPPKGVHLTADELLDALRDRRGVDVHRQRLLRTSVATTHDVPLMTPPVARPSPGEVGGLPTIVDLPKRRIGDPGPARGERMCVMDDVASLPDPDTLAWLLDGDDPSVRYFTLTRLLEEPVDGAVAEAARRAIMTAGVVPRILAAQGDDGHWGERDRFYTAKYSGTAWQLIILAELGADGADLRVRRACEAILGDSQDSASGGFSIARGKKAGGGLHSSVIPCLTGNLVFSLIRLGYLDDPRLRRAVDWITTYQRFDDGDGDPPTGWPYDPMEMCWGRHTCHMGVVKSLKALAEIPPERRSAEVGRTLAGGAEYLLKHRVHRRSHDLTRDSKPGWRRFGFPLMYQTDVLEVLGILTRLGVKDGRMDEALALVASRRDAQGRLALQNTFNGRFVVDIEAKGGPSRWITLRALEVLGTARRGQTG